MAARFLDSDRATPYLLPPSVDEWVEAQHLSRFVVDVVDVVDALDLSALSGRYSGRGKKAYHPLGAGGDGVLRLCDRGIRLTGAGAGQ
jgi:hypothetical protein